MQHVFKKKLKKKKNSIRNDLGWHPSTFPLKWFMLSVLESIHKLKGAKASEMCLVTSPWLKKRVLHSHCKAFVTHDANGPQTVVHLVLLHWGIYLHRLNGMNLFLNLLLPTLSNSIHTVELQDTVKSSCHYSASSIGPLPIWCFTVSLHMKNTEIDGSRL